MSKFTRTPSAVHFKTSAESPLTLEQVREAVEFAWADATRLPTTPGSLEVCEHLQQAAECLDVMIDRKVGRLGHRTKSEPQEVKTMNSINEQQALDILDALVKRLLKENKALREELANGRESDVWAAAFGASIAETFHLPINHGEAAELAAKRAVEQLRLARSHEPHRDRK